MAGPRQVCLWTAGWFSVLPLPWRWTCPRKPLAQDLPSRNCPTPLAASEPLTISGQPPFSTSTKPQSPGLSRRLTSGALAG